MTSVVRLLRRIWAFAFPRPGWKKRVAQYSRGQTVWRFSGNFADKLPAVGPWPPEWTPFRVVVKSTGPEVEFMNVVSAVSGKSAEGEDAVYCARCGIPLHVADTKMETNLDIPSCAWCRDMVESA